MVHQKVDTVEIDGSHGEGGGSVLRLCAAMGLVFQKKIHVYKIRANRDKPGLREQHLMGLQALAALCGGKLEGGAVGSTDVTFEPGTIKPGRVAIKIGTAGAIGLVYQILSVACAAYKADEGELVEVDIGGGGTFNKWAPSTSYVRGVLIPLLRRAGFASELEVLRHGFYPKGGAQARITFHPVDTLKGLMLDARGEITAIRGESVSTIHLRSARVAERQAASFTSAVKARFQQSDVAIETRYVDAMNPGSGITAWATTGTGCIISSGSVVGERGIKSEVVGQECARDLIKALQGSPHATVDEFTSDQLIPFMAVSKERSVIIAPKLTSHARTNIDMMRLFTDRPIDVQEQSDHVALEFPAVP
ncbi:MAG: RNA 3'-phosphate cyclase [Candidatus Lokiarchaeota archaeon]|nr:RNA 3'-phosphate cyclase [Candidatus Lokiarchaeota archaeon]